MNGGFDQAELSLTEWLLNFVEVMQIRVANHLLDGSNPAFFILTSLEVVGSGLGRREDKREGV